MSELAQSVSQLGELIPTVPDQLEELIGSARTVDSRTDAVCDVLDQAHEQLEQHEQKLLEEAGRLVSAAQQAQEQLAAGLAQVETTVRVAREASDAFSDGALAESTSALDAALDAARDRLQSGASRMEDATRVIEGDLGGLRAHADTVGAAVSKGVEAVVASLGEVDQAMEAAESEVIAGVDRLADVVDEVVAQMGAETAALLEAAIAGRDQAIAGIQEANGALDTLRQESVAEADQRTGQLVEAMSEAIRRLHGSVDTVNAQLAAAAQELHGLREEYERLAEGFGWSEQPLNSMIGEVRKAADQAGIPFA